MAVKRTAWLLYQHELSKHIGPEHALENVLKWMAGQRARQSFHQLTPTEQRVIRLIVEGMTQQQIALELGCNHNGVKMHMKRIRRKLKFASTYQVIALAVARGWVKAPRLDD